MAGWIPAPDGIEAAIDQLAADVAGMYANAEFRLIQAIMVDLQRGINRPGSIETSVRLGRLRAAAQQIVNELETAGPDFLQRVVDAAAQGGAHAALQQLSQLTGITDITTNAIWATGNTAANLLIADLTSKMMDMNLRILRYPDDVYRAAVAKYGTDPILGLSTSRIAQQKIWQDLLNQGITGFTDVSGRRWNLATYTEMATRTATHRAWTDGHLAQLTGNGQDLVSVVVGIEACRSCSQFAGKILSINGPAGNRVIEHAINDYQYVNVDVYMTVDQARTQKGHFQGPNCRCRMVAYLPGLSIPTDSSSYDERANTARMDLRSLEVHVRKAKMEIATSLSPAEARLGQRKVLDLQAQIRDLVDAEDLQRKRYREQINLGFKNIPA